MADEMFVNVTYRGLVMGERLRLRPIDAASAHVEHSAPMPVGTELVVVSDGEVRTVVRVAQVHEQHEAATEPRGMRVIAQAARGAAPWWHGEDAEPEAEEAQAAIAEPVAEADDGAPEASAAEVTADTGEVSGTSPAAAEAPAEGSARGKKRRGGGKRRRR